MLSTGAVRITRTRRQQYQLAILLLILLFQRFKLNLRPRNLFTECSDGRQGVKRTVLGLNRAWLRLSNDCIRVVFYTDGLLLLTLLVEGESF